MDTHTLICMTGHVCTKRLCTGHFDVGHVTLDVDVRDVRTVWYSHKCLFLGLRTNIDDTYVGNAVTQVTAESGQSSSIGCARGAIALQLQDQQ